ncbi:MAG TPA: hypothetical protein VG992_04445 [Candidatus Saccharimonadales bacterium]|nr:hypothetical protein [Candidatus Saccharimonadales bacterium]
MADENVAAQETTPNSFEDASISDQLAHASENTETISWTASEFVAHQKSAGWYSLLFVAALVLAALAFLLTKDYITPVIVMFVAIIFGLAAARQPRELPYQLDGHGLTIGQRFYSYTSFRSFAVVAEGAFSSITFMPLKRFAPLTSIYFAPEDEEKIVKLLADRLPMTEHHLDAVDRMLRRIRF